MVSKFGDKLEQESLIKIADKIKNENEKNKTKEHKKNEEDLTNSTEKIVLLDKVKISSDENIYSSNGDENFN